MLKLSELTITQEEVRHKDQTCAMVDFVRGGGFYSYEQLDGYAAEHGLPKVSPLIQISRFEDGMQFIHDGHHRLLSIHLGGRDFIHENEYEVTEWVYQDYLDIVLYKVDKWVGWVTPHDPREEIRLPELKDYKKQVQEVVEKAEYDYESEPQPVVDFIKANRHQFAKPRGISRIDEMSFVQDYLRGTVCSS